MKRRPLKPSHRELEHMAGNSLLLSCRRVILHLHLRWEHDPRLWVKLFVTANLAILAADSYIAHSVNRFGKAAEYIPHISPLRLRCSLRS